MVCYKIKSYTDNEAITYSNPKFYCTYSISSSFCVLHDLMIEYLQQPIDHQRSVQQYSIILNKKLIDGYHQQSQGNWSNHPDDAYYYQYLI